MQSYQIGFLQNRKRLQRYTSSKKIQRICFRTASESATVRPHLVPLDYYSLAERSLCRHTPEVGAVCGKAARTVLCGGREVTRVPTASGALLHCICLLMMWLTAPAPGDESP
jgi:hypothetical protein